MQEQNFNTISELTEQLDASHVFCEGVEKHYIKKACEWFKSHQINYWFVSDYQFNCMMSELAKAMKGE